MVVQEHVELCGIQGHILELENIWLFVWKAV